MQIEVIEPHRIRFIWPVVRRHIEASQRRGPTDMSVDDIHWCCAHDETWRLVVIDGGRAAAVVRVWDERLHVVTIAGKFDKGWTLEFFEWLASMARFMGLTAISLGGRKGWARLLAPLGFKSIGGPYLGVQIK